MVLLPISDVFPELFWVILTGNIFSCTLSMTVFILTSVDGDRFICLSLDEFCGILLQLYPICWPLRAILGEACKVPQFVVSWTLGWLSTILEKWRWRIHILLTLLLTLTDVRLRTGGWLLCWTRGIIFWLSVHLVTRCRPVVTWPCCLHHIGVAFIFRPSS